MDTQVRTPSHVCRHCGEWWVVEPIEQDRWIILRYGDDLESRNQTAFVPECPDCEGVLLEQWLIDDRSHEKQT